MTQALLEHGHRAIGLCNVAIGFQRGFAAQFGVAPERVQLEHVGLNHLTLGAGGPGRRRRPPARADRGDAAGLAAEMGLPVELIRLLRAVPSYYLRYYYATTRCWREQLAGRPRAEEVMEIERGLLEMYADPALDVKPKLLEQRGGAFYCEAAAMLIASLYGGPRRRPGREHPQRRRDARRRRRRRSRGPCADHGDGRPSAAARRAGPAHARARRARQGLRAAHCAGGRDSGDRDVALEALLANPLVGEFDVAEPLLDALLAANREHLPRFFGENVPA